MQSVPAKTVSEAWGHPLRPLLVWLLVALVLILAGCGGAPAAADAPQETARNAAKDTATAALAVKETFPKSYPDAVPASDEVVLKWNGTLVLPGEAHPIVRTSN